MAFVWERFWMWADTIWWSLRPQSMRDAESWPGDAPVSEMAVTAGHDEDDGPVDDEEDDAA